MPPVLKEKKRNIAISKVIKYIDNPPKSPFERGTLRNSPLSKGGKGGYKTVPHAFLELL